MNQTKLEEYIELYGKDIYSFCRYLTRNVEDADDLYQQTFLVAIQKDDIDEGNNPKSYLITIASNIWNNHKRKFLWRQKKADVVYLQSEDMEAIGDGKDAIIDEVLKEEERQMVQRLVYELPEKLRIVILMHYMEEMSVEEISKALSIPPGTVKSRIYNAKAKLAERMEA
ncbi:MAG: RNA polymerase sigma factor [Lachnospiraceae bacterium]|nr:RNA polymerase sigma factor [Lachnospiraceae bacterium]